MKKFLTIISVTLVAIILLSTNLCPFAVSIESKTISDYTIYDLKEMTIEEKLKLLKQFEKEYGFDSLSSSSNFNHGISLYWTSGNPFDPNYELSEMETHELMTIDAISLLCDTGYFITNDATEALVFTLYLARASALPDREVTGIGLVYAGHFYNPETGKSFLPVSSTARSNMVKNYNSAYKKFQKVDGDYLNSKDFQDGLEYIGKMLHYVQDACEPHHSSNEIALPNTETPHSEFESFVFKNYEECSKYYSWESVEYQQCLSQSKNDIGMIVHRAAIKSHVYIDGVNNLDNRNQWSNVGSICTRNSISLSAISMRIAFDNAGILVSL